MEILFFATTGVLGIFLGAQITEAVLFVPYWKALSADEFFDLYQTYGRRIYLFFAPLTIGATVLPIITVLTGLLHQAQNHLLMGCMGFSTLAFFSTYFLFFKKANKKFTNREVTNQDLPNEIRRWGIWHWGRICFEGIAFVCSLLLLAEIHQF